MVSSAIVIWSTVIGGAIAAFTGFGTSILANWFQTRRERETYARQVERERIAYVRRLRDERRDRLRRIYPTILDAAQAYQSALHELNFVMVGETEEIRNARLNESLSVSLAPLNRTMIDLILENIDDVQIQTIFDEIRKSFNWYVSHLRTLRQYGSSLPPGVIDWVKEQSQLTDEEHKIDAKVEELTQAMKGHLAQLETVDGPPPAISVATANGVNQWRGLDPRRWPMALWQRFHRLPAESTPTDRTPS